MSHLFVWLQVNSQFLIIWASFGQKSLGKRIVHFHILKGIKRFCEGANSSDWKLKFEKSFQD